MFNFFKKDKEEEKEEDKEQDIEVQEQDEQENEEQVQEEQAEAEPETEAKEETEAKQKEVEDPTAKRQAYFLEEEEKEKKGFFTRLKEGLSKTRQGFVSRVSSIFTSRSTIDDELYEELEEILIQADVGVKTTMDLIDHLQQMVEADEISEPEELYERFQDEISRILHVSEEELPLPEDWEGLKVLMVVGVNGAGKTTTIAKLANRYKQKGKDVLLAAGDTFRAGAIDQLKVWGGRIGIDVIAQSEGADAAAVAYDAVQAARSRGTDLLIVDTAGRLHTQTNLMSELQKVRKVIGREAGEDRVETLLVLDATTGQNALNQAKLFDQAVQVDGVALTKLDGTARGGIVVAVKNELGLPIRLIGVGEAAEDLQDFEPDEFVAALFSE